MLRPSLILIYKIHKIILNCAGKQLIKNGCDFCMMSIPCACSITADDFYIQPAFTHCKTNNNITKIYPVNLILMQHFFAQEKLALMQANSTLNNQIEVNIPKFHIYNHSFSTFLANDKKTHLNLSKMVQIAKQDGVIFQNLEEPLLEDMINIKAIWPDLNGI